MCIIVILLSILIYRVDPAWVLVTDILIKSNMYQAMITYNFMYKYNYLIIIILLYIIIIIIISYFVRLDTINKFT